MSRPKHPALKQGHANTAARPKAAPRLKRPIPDPPESLTFTGKQWWMHLWALNLPWTESDAYAVQRYVELRTRRDRLQRVLDVDELVQDGSKGQPVMHPALKAIAEVESSLKALEVQLLLTPDARARWGLDNEEDSPLDDWIDSANAEFE